ncbi:carbohydrate ABC transporter permease [Caldibacillus lycopersici]|uniref:Carbohydrate ABC transporter permease n=1 Tax=Perspicuibacillus lycopersici TaxID=1325689 RepID=A0AAE3LMU2_9BACI|nr:carbohydrate ABC transporter permease [Perspicuibacillus lycopersici]MCU9613286.1 carbohydrate ABC transporter permease [Perspicuibacillus lycopersici]
MRKAKRLTYFNYVLIILVTLIFIFPFIWMLIASFKTQAQIMSTDTALFFQPTFDNYRSVFGEHNFLTYIINSFIVAFVSTVFGLILGLPAAYAIAKYKQQKLGFVILIARIIPGISFMIPWFIIFTKLNLTDSYTALVLSHMLVGLPFIIWIMIPSFEGLPAELEDAARVDGCTLQGAFVKVLLPLVMPGIITSSLMSFILSWNNFMFALVLSGEKTKTLPIAIFNFMSYSEINWGALMAAAVIITFPIIIISLFVQRYIISGVTAGAVKG